MINLFKIRKALITLLCIAGFNVFATSPKVNVAFKEDVIKFTTEEKSIIIQMIDDLDLEVRKLLPNLPDNIEVMVEGTDRNIDIVHGVVGRTDRNSPALITIQVSKSYQGGNVEALGKGLRTTIFHEYHHLSRGWAIQDNHFGPGIPNAMVNEGLAVVFAEIYTGDINQVNAYPDEAGTWVKEILALPLDASYSDWVMGEHPDGRTSIGYRAGNFLVRQAMDKSGKNILELSRLNPDEIIALAGY